MPGLYKDEAIVLRSMKLGEADRIVTLFTRENGKVRAVAKGVRKTKSRWGGRLEPFGHIQVMLYRGKGDLDTITGADTMDTFKDVRTAYDRMMGAAALAELVEKITPERERALSTYALLLGGLGSLASGGGPSVVPAFIVKLLSLAGYHPQLNVCVGCGRPDMLDGFSPALGGVVCGDCWDRDPSAMRMPVEYMVLLTRLLAAEFGQPASPEAVKDLTHALRRYAEFHLERPLRSLQLLAV